MTDTQKLRELLAKAIKRAYHLGQEYWRLADSESYSDNRRSGDTQAKFDALLFETVSVVCAQLSIAQDEIDRLSAALAERDEGWVSVDDRLPGEDDTVLAAHIDGGVEIVFGSLLHETYFDGTYTQIGRAHV